MAIRLTLLLMLALVPSLAFATETTPTDPPLEGGTLPPDPSTYNTIPASNLAVAIATQDWMFCKDFALFEGAFAAIRMYNAEALVDELAALEVELLQAHTNFNFRLFTAAEEADFYAEYNAGMAGPPLDEIDDGEDDLDAGQISYNGGDAYASVWEPNEMIRKQNLTYYYGGAAQDFMAASAHFDAAIAAINDNMSRLYNARAMMQAAETRGQLMR